MQAIVNVDENWGIGRDGNQPFYIPEDLAFFKRVTKGKVVVMGRATLAALPNGAPLKNRTNIVLTTQQDLTVENAIICHSIPHLLEIVADYPQGDIMVIGGAKIYETLLPHCDVAHITKIAANGKCDRFFPNLDKNPKWKLESQSETKTYDGIDFWFCKYVKI